MASSVSRGVSGESLTRRCGVGSRVRLLLEGIARGRLAGIFGDASEGSPGPVSLGSATATAGLPASSQPGARWRFEAGCGPARPASCRVMYEISASSRELILSP